jgi:hypothetical protein
MVATSGNGPRCLGAEHVLAPRIGPPARLLQLDLNEVMTPTVRTAINWIFGDRATGKLVIAQRPNVPLTLWLACVLAGWLVHPQGRWSTVLGAVGTIALVIWAGDEVVRGVNPWRRILGAGVLVAILLSWALSP